MNSGFISHNKGNLFYQTTGTGEPIVFIHGFSLDHRMWIPQIEHFSKTNQVIVYDMRGFGRSSLPEGNYSHHDDLKAILDELNLQEINMVGLSLGGEVAIDFTLEFPEYVKSLTLISSSLGGYKSNVDWNVSAKEGGIEKSKENWLKHKVFSYSIKNTAVKKQLEDMISDYSGWHWLNKDPRTKLNPTAKDRLEEIQIPVKILVGEKDLDYYHHIGKTLDRNTTNSQLEVIKKVGHMTNMESIDKTNRIIISNLV